MEVSGGGGVGVPPLMTGSEAHRLWRLLAYKMAAPQANDEEEEEEEVWEVVVVVVGQEEEEEGFSGLAGGGEEGEEVGDGVEDPRYHPTAPSINLRTRPEPPNTLEEVSLDGESDHEEFVRSAHYRDASQPQQHARAKAQRMPQWSAVGTPRLIGRGFPRPPGSPLPKIAEDGTGPLDLGLEPPRSGKGGWGW